MKLALAGILIALALPAGAAAQQVAAIKPAAIKPTDIKPFPIYYPAPEFDHPYKGELTTLLPRVPKSFKRLAVMSRPLWGAQNDGRPNASLPLPPIASSKLMDGQWKPSFGTKPPIVTDGM